MATKKTTRKSSARKSSAVIKRAQHILKSQKADYRKIFKSEIREGGSPTKAAKRAGSVYRSRYGATGYKRWENALKLAQRFEKN